ncbi:MAG: NAD(P)(+) transhydrogenase (Re/Si-specific) subunit alpha, partial [Pseudomonadota bacterium]|nr:NAD(P)(+) transhydrogenase (Re/Si-specific) subunit alpha [Pseudomonadota bacterium]
MKIGCPTETFEGERRVAMTPDSIRQILKLGHDCVVQSGAGDAAGFPDAAYEEAGAAIVKTAATLWKQADIVVKVRGVTKKEESQLRVDQTVISLFWPAQNPELLETFKSSGTNAVAMDMVPRSSRAQKMAVLSSMANIAGYRAVIEAGNQFGRLFTGQITAAGKV